MVYKHQAVSVVYFMLKHPGQKSGSLYPDWTAVFIQGSNPYFVVARHLTVYIGYTQTALKIRFNFALKLHNLGVDKYVERLIVLIIKVISNNNYSVGLIYLNRRQSHTNLVRPGS